MTREEILGRLRQALATNFNVPGEVVKGDSRLRNGLGLNSLDLVDFVFVLQEEFGLKVDLHLYGEIESVDQLVDFIEKRRRETE
jgi:acyl carrier protein